MGRLEEKASNTKDMLLKGIILFAVLGCIILIIAVNMISKTFTDFLQPPDEQNQKDKQSQSTPAK